MGAQAKRSAASASSRRGRKVPAVGGGLVLAAVATVAVAVFAGRSDEDAIRSMSPASTVGTLKYMLRPGYRPVPFDHASGGLDSVSRYGL